MLFLVKFSFQHRGSSAVPYTSNGGRYVTRESRKTSKVIKKLGTFLGHVVVKDFFELKVNI